MCVRPLLSLSSRVVFWVVNIARPIFPPTKRRLAPQERVRRRTRLSTRSLCITLSLASFSNTPRRANYTFKQFHDHGFNCTILACRVSTYTVRRSRFRVQTYLRHLPPRSSSRALVRSLLRLVVVATATSVCFAAVCRGAGAAYSAVNVVDTDICIVALCICVL